MAASNYTAVFKLPLPIGTDLVSRQDVLSLSNGVEQRAVPSPMATATIVGTALNIVSVVPKVAVNYEVLFISPEAYDSAKSLIIDDERMTGLYDMRGSLVSNGAWVGGVPVSLIRIGTKVYLIGGSGLSDAERNNILYKNNPIADNVDSTANKLRNTQVQNSGGTAVSTSWLRMRR